MDAQYLTRLAMERSGVADNYSAMARRMRLGPGGDKRVKRWATGGGDPSYEATIELLRLAGLLREEPAAEAPAAAEQELLDVRLEALEERVKEAVRLSKRTVKLLLQAQTGADGAPRSQRRGRTGTDGV